MKLLCYRYMWTVKDVKDKVNFKIITDVEDVHKKFIESVFALPDVENVGREYVCEYDVSQIGLFQDLKNI